MRRIGSRMRELADIVSAMPGISQRGALRAADLPDAGMGHRRPLDRAVAAGLIIRELPPGRGKPYRLFASERDRQLFGLREELLRGNPDAARAEAIVAEIEALRAEQAATWAE